MKFIPRSSEQLWDLAPLVNGVPTLQGEGENPIVDVRVCQIKLFDRRKTCACEAGSAQVYTLRAWYG